MPEVLKGDTGIGEAHMVGKWHLGYAEYEYTPTFRGFDSYYGYLTGSEDYYTHIDGGGYDLRYQKEPRCGRGCEEIRTGENGTYSTHLFTERAEDIIRRFAEKAGDSNSDSNSESSGGGLFLYLAYQAVHAPAQVPPSYSSNFSFPSPSRNAFAGMLSCADEGIGNVTRALGDAGMLGDTLVVVTSDNGAPTPACGGAQGGQNYPLRGGKCTAWEGGLRAATIVAGAGIGEGRRGTVHEGIFHNTDWLPTIRGAVNGEVGDGDGDGDRDGRRGRREFVGDGVELDGVNQWGMISLGHPSAREVALLEADPHSYPSDGPDWGGDQHSTPYYALRKGDYKLILGDPGQSDAPISNAWYCTGPPCPGDHNNTENATSVPAFTADSVQLFDVRNDPSETDDLAGENGDIVSDMREILEGFLEEAVSSEQQGLPDDQRGNPDNFDGIIMPWL